MVDTNVCAIADVIDSWIKQRRREDLDAQSCYIDTRSARSCHSLSDDGCQERLKLINSHITIIFDRVQYGIQ